jgi:hypothetical protein
MVSADRSGGGLGTPKISKNWQKSRKIGKNLEKLAKSRKIAKNWQKLAKIVQKCQKLPKIAKNWQKMAIFRNFSPQNEKFRSASEKEEKRLENGTMTPFWSKRGRSRPLFWGASFGLT